MAGRRTKDRYFESTRARWLPCGLRVSVEPGPQCRNMSGRIPVDTSTYFPHSGAQQKYLILTNLMTAQVSRLGHELSGGWVGGFD